MASSPQQIKYYSSKHGHTNMFFNGAKRRAKKKNLPFDLTHEYLISIAHDVCPVFGVPFNWGISGKGYGIPKSDNAPSLDRGIPELGYIKGNVVFISRLANNIKSTATEKELYAVADWLHDKRKEVMNAHKDKLTSIPAAPDTPGRRPSASGAVHGPGPRKIGNGAHHYQEREGWEDPGDRPQARSGVGMGSGVPEVGTPIDLADELGDGFSDAAIDSVIEQIRYLHHKCGERAMAGGKLEARILSVFDNRRKQPVQGPKHKAIQGAQESPERVSPSNYTHGHTDSSGAW